MRLSSVVMHVEGVSGATLLRHQMHARLYSVSLRAFIYSWLAVQ